jgi:glycosyltransferase involved in cell wall biosynthesis
MWETEVIPRQLHRPLALVDEIWTATEFVAAGYRAVTDTPVQVTGHAVDVSGVEQVGRSELGIADDAFVVHFSLDANSTVARKNPSAAIDAFHGAFEGDPTAVFLLKVRNMQQAEHLARSGDPHARGLMDRLRDDPAIRLVTGELSHGRSLGLIQLADCFISLHRSEGYGYAVAEAMALGTPVIATDYSGSTDLLSDCEGWPVGYALVDVLPEEYFYWEPGMQWAEADIAAAGQALRQVREGIDVEVRVSRARERVTATASMAALSHHYRTALLRRAP